MLLSDCSNDSNQSELSDSAPPPSPNITVIVGVTVNDIELSQCSKHSKRHRLSSISGPSSSSPKYGTFLAVLSLMIWCGSWSDFLGKLFYQIEPMPVPNYWSTYFLTIGSFLICCCALFTESARSSFHKLDGIILLKICIPSVLDLLVTGGRYFALSLLSAATVSALKNGSQLIFLSILRRWIHRKSLTKFHCFSIAVSLIGLSVVFMESIMASSSGSSPSSSSRASPSSAISARTEHETVNGVILSVSIGLLGAIRNDIEELLLKEEDLSPTLLVGVHSAISALFLFPVGAALTVIDSDSLQFPSALMAVTFVLFLLAIYGKDTMQMAMTSLSSSLTRKLFEQIYPVGTWCLSLLCYAMTAHKFGESWNGLFSWMRLIGFITVMIGNYFYINGPPKWSMNINVRF